jgi:hypothetical protein
MRSLRFLTLIVACVTLLCNAALAADTFVLQGKITSLEGQGVAEAEVYLYTSKNTRRPADFISPKSDPGGSYRMVLPPGVYWAVARIKKGERFGPLMPGDRHSGEPVRIAPEGDPELTQDFTVADMQELAQKREKSREELMELSGTLTDADGKGVAGAYVYARTGLVTATLPEYLSAWTDDSGKYRLKLPPGHYFLGIARTFPPPGGTAPIREIELPAGKLPVAIDLQIPVE